MPTCSMDARLSVSDLKQKLLEEVRTFFRRDGSVWKKPILDVIQDLRQSNIHAVLFGGTLRSLLVSRIFQGRPGRPRDVDVVITGASLSRLEERFSDILTRRTRFGGLQLKRGAWQFDVWPLGETWAFRQDRISGLADFAALPATTPFNLEAIAVEAWPCAGGRRALFSGNDQFFEGILSRTVELNRVDNPFPELTVIRALVMASELRFRIGPRLAGYIGDIGPSISDEVVDQIQASHYGHVRIASRTLHQLIEMVAQRSSRREGCALPAMGQLHLWQDAAETPWPNMNIQCLESSSTGVSLRPALAQTRG